MFDIENAYVDIEAIEEGRWVSLGPEFGDAAVLVKGLTSAGASKLQAKLTRQAPRLDRLPNGRLTDEAQERILKETIIERCVQDWRGIGSGGKALAFSKEALRAFMYEKKARKIAVAVIMAITDLEQSTAASIEEVEGN